mmetsp:Transcript_73374/g.203699  ORF Transcript_73374/g.203699 Transcript_73374/m.203699 type:complete len:565 (-) Transcript_73374:1878-3572(-)
MRVALELLRSAQPRSQCVLGVFHRLDGGRVAVLRCTLVAQRQREELDLRNLLFNNRESLPLLLDRLGLVRICFCGRRPHARDRFLPGFQAAGQLRQLGAVRWRLPEPRVLLLFLNHCAGGRASLVRSSSGTLDLASDLLQLRRGDGFQVVLLEFGPGFHSFGDLRLSLANGLDGLWERHLGLPRESVDLELSDLQDRRFRMRQMRADLLCGSEAHELLGDPPGLLQKLHQGCPCSLHQRFAVLYDGSGHLQRGFRLFLRQHLVALPWRLRLRHILHPGLGGLALAPSLRQQRPGAETAALLPRLRPELLEALPHSLAAFLDAHDHVVERPALLLMAFQSPHHLQKGLLGEAHGPLCAGDFGLGIYRNRKGLAEALHVGLQRIHFFGEVLHVLPGPQLLLVILLNGLVGVETLLCVDQPVPHWRDFSEGSPLLRGGESGPRLPDARIHLLTGLGDQNLRAVHGGLRRLNGLTDRARLFLVGRKLRTAPSEVADLDDREIHRVLGAVDALERGTLQDMDDVGQLALPLPDLPQQFCELLPGLGDFLPEPRGDGLQARPEHRQGLRG